MSVFSFHLPSAGVTGMSHTTLMEPMTLFMLGKDSTSQASLSFLTVDFREVVHV